MDWETIVCTLDEQETKPEMLDKQWLWLSITGLTGFLHTVLMSNRRWEDWRPNRNHIRGESDDECDMKVSVQQIPQIRHSQRITITVWHVYMWSVCSCPCPQSNEINSRWLTNVSWLHNCHDFCSWLNVWWLNSCSWKSAFPVYLNP